MTNFDLYDQAQQLADTRSAYSLAWELLEAKAQLEELQAASRSLEVAANTVGYCFDRQQGNFASAIQSLARNATNVREACAKIASWPSK